MGIGFWVRVRVTVAVLGFTVTFRVRGRVEAQATYMVCWAVYDVFPGAPDY